MIQKALPLAVLSAVFWVLFCRKTQKSTSHQLGEAKRRNAFDFIKNSKKQDLQPAKLAAQSPLILNLKGWSQQHHQLGTINRRSVFDFQNTLIHANKTAIYTPVQTM